MMNIIFIISVLGISSAVMLTIGLQANQVSDNNNGTGESECANLKINYGECTNYNEMTKVRYEGYCPYIFKFKNHKSIDHKIACSEVNKMICGQLKREGLLCSKCKKGYGPDLYSRKSNCVRCSKKTLCGCGSSILQCYSLPSPYFFL